jgi:hypothetical protein
MAKAALRKRRRLLQQIELKSKDEAGECYFWSVTLYGAGKQTLQKVDQKYLESFEMEC